ncbi:Acetylcholine receptor subunit alpha-like [Papilio xuthus]|uniref:Acetylcholine receptor subunit alpha-like n=1 Tax=Papilio xuthus TaxID=66420 RepID=A0A194QPK1_PAPXU|nr:Acetylcholine receptor subunit alpha-like [Papilio xuthus]
MDLYVFNGGAVAGCAVCAGNPDAKRLYDDLLSNYNKLVRPVLNVSDALTVRIKLKLSQLIDVNLKNQIMTTNLWVEQSWFDYKLSWEPREYGGVEMLHVPSDHIWRPDIVLYNKKQFTFTIHEQNSPLGRARSSIRCRMNVSLAWRNATTTHHSRRDALYSLPV